MADNAGSVDDSCIFWYALKSITNSTIAFASHFIRTRLGKIDDLELKLASLEQQQHISFSENRKENTEATKTELSSLAKS